jgi:hypothetical protein
VAAAQIDLAQMKLRIHVIGSEFYGPTKHLESAVPVSQALITKRALVKCVDVTGVDLKRTRVRDLRFGIFAFLEEGVALRDEFLFANVGIPGTGRQKNDCEEK